MSTKTIVRFIVEWSLFEAMTIAAVAVAMMMVASIGERNIKEDRNVSIFRLDAHAVLFLLSRLLVFTNKKTNNVVLSLVPNVSV